MWVRVISLQKERWRERYGELAEEARYINLVYVGGNVGWLEAFTWRFLMLKGTLEASDQASFPSTLYTVDFHSWRS